MVANNPFLQNSDARSKKDIFTDFLQTIVLALAFSLILYLVFLVPSIVDGESMEPNFYDNELLFANKTIQWLGDTSIGTKLNYDYKRGDVIIFESQGIKLIKRIIATEGDTVKIEGGNVYVNGTELNEYYLPDSFQSILPTGERAFLDEGEVIRVPENAYFVMGDNRPRSKDSRYKEVGFVPRSNIKGRVFLRYWPITRFGIIRSVNYEK